MYLLKARNYMKSNFNGTIDLFIVSYAFAWTCIGSQVDSYMKGKTAIALLKKLKNNQD